MARLIRIAVLLMALVAALSSPDVSGLRPTLTPGSAQSDPGVAVPSSGAPVLAMDEDDEHHGMWGDWGSWGWWLFFMPMMVVFWGGVIWLIVSLLRQTSNAGGRDDDAVEIARRRYARGEITREEFEQIRRDLGG